MKKTKDQIQNEALEAVRDLQKAGVEMSMGAGKTLLCLKHMVENYTETSRFLVVAPKLPIFDSWRDDAKKFDLEFLLANIEFVTYLSLKKKDPEAYDIIYLDECHSLKESHSMWLTTFFARGGKILGITGTYPKFKSNEKGKMCNLFCPKVYEYKVDDAVNDSLLNDYRITVHLLQLNPKRTLEKKKKNGQVWYSSEQQDYEYWCNRLDSASPAQEQMCRIMRMRALMNYQTKVDYAKTLLEKANNKTIVFATTKDQAKLLCNDYIFSGYKKSQENLEKFKFGEIEKLSAVEQLSEGVTIPNLKTGIILHAFSNNRKASQKIGRMLRLNPKDVAQIHILCYQDTIDKIWVEKALSHFDQSKINWVDV